MESIAIGLNKIQRKNARMFDQNVVIQCCSNGLPIKQQQFRSQLNFRLLSEEIRKTYTNDMHRAAGQSNFVSTFSNLHFGVSIIKNPLQWSYNSRSTMQHDELSHSHRSIEI